MSRTLSKLFLVGARPRKTLSFFSLVLLFPWCFSCCGIPWIFREFSAYFTGFSRVLKGRTWAIAVRRGSYKSLFLLNSGHFPCKKIGKFSSELWFAQNGLNRYFMAQVLSSLIFRVLKARKTLGVLRFSLVFSKRPRKRRTGEEKDKSGKSPDKSGKSRKDRASPKNRSLRNSARSKPTTEFAQPRLSWATAEGGAKRIA